jgi:hypothetical protein
MGGEWSLVLGSHAPLHAAFMAVVAFAVAFAAAIAAIAAARRLPARHLGPDNRQAIKVTLDLLSVLVALVLGLMIADAKDTFDTQSSTLRRLSAQAILLDQVLEEYGPETGRARALLRSAAKEALSRLEGAERTSSSVSIDPRLNMREFISIIGGLPESTELKRTLRQRAVQLVGDMGEQRLQLYVQQDQGMPPAVLVSLVGWLAILFAGYGLLSPRNAVGVIALFASAVGVAAAIFLVEELGRPLDGLIRLSPAPLQDAVNVLGS